MNQVVNKFLLTGDKFMPEMPGYLDPLIAHVDHLLEINKEFKNLCKQEIQIISTKMNWVKLVFNMIWLMANVKTQKKEHNQIKS